MKLIMENWRDCADATELNEELMSEIKAYAQQNYKQLLADGKTEEEIIEALVEGFMQKFKKKLGKAGAAAALGAAMLAPGTALADAQPAKAQAPISQQVQDTDPAQIIHQATPEQKKMIFDLTSKYMHANMEAGQTPRAAMENARSQAIQDVMSQAR